MAFGFQDLLLICSAGLAAENSDGSANGVYASILGSKPNSILILTIEL
jgi:hypothetical protein